MLAGQPPFDGATAFEVAMKHGRDEPPPLASIRPDLPESLCAVVHKMLAKDPAQRHQTGRELIRDLARVREGLSGQTMLVARTSFAADPAPASSPSLPAAPAATTGAMPKPSRWVWGIVAFALSLVAAVALGGAAAWVRRQAVEAPPTPAAASADAGDVDDDLPLNDEELRKVVDKYLRSPNAADVSVGMGLCLDLGTRYLDQHRLDDAEKLFEKLDGMQNVRPYQLLGRLGRGIVLALRDQADESNRLFRDAFTEPLFKDIQKRWQDGKLLGPDVGKMWTNPKFRFWLAQAASYNTRNGTEVPPALKWLSEPHPRP